MTSSKARCPDEAVRDMRTRPLATLATMRPLALLSLSIPVLLAAACTFNLPASWSWNYYARSGLADHTASQALTLKCPDDAIELRMTSTIRTEQGTLRIRLFDPKGTCRVDETLRAGERDGNLVLPPSAGTWRCALDYVSFGGDCSIELSARGAEMLTVTVEPTSITTGR